MAFTYSFSHLLSTSPPTMETHFLYSGSSGLALPSLPSSSSGFTSIGRLLVYAISYFYLLLLASSFWLFRWPGGTVEEWTRKVGRGVWGGWVGSRWEGFVEQILGGLFGAVGTCRDQDVGSLEVGLLLGEFCLPSLRWLNLKVNSSEGRADRHVVACLSLSFSEYIYLTLFTDHYTAPTSSSSISRALTGAIPPSNIHLSTSIISLRRDPSSSTTSISYTTTTSFSTSPDQPLTMSDFDEIVIGTQANQANRLLNSLLSNLNNSDASSSELEEVETSLGHFRYVKTIVVNHISPSVLPTPSFDIRDINLLRCPSPPPLLPNTDGPPPTERLDYFPPSPQNTYTQSTHILYPPPSYSKTHGPVYQTTNPIMPIPKESILSIAHFERFVSSASLSLPTSLPLFSLSSSSKLTFSVLSCFTLSSLQSSPHRPLHLPPPASPPLPPSNPPRARGHLVRRSLRLERDPSPRRMREECGGGRGWEGWNFGEERWEGEGEGGAEGSLMGWVWISRSAIGLIRFGTTLC